MDRSHRAAASRLSVVLFPRRYSREMTGAEVAALTWAADFIKSVLSSVLGDRLKSKTSPERAQWLALQLYEAMGNLQRESRAFVAALRALADRGTGPVDEWQATDLREALVGVSGAIDGLQSILEKLDPQLEIHAPEVATEVVSARRSRAMVISGAEYALLALEQGSEPVDFGPLVAEADRAQEGIQEATEALRSFLAAEFTFKESF